VVNEVGQLDEQVPSARAPVLGQEIDARAVPTVAVEGLDIPGVFERIEQMLLGGPRRYTRAQVAAEAGISRAEANELWRALGFATVGDDEVVFTDGDVEALRTAADLTERLGADNELRTAITRLLGRTFAQLASFQGQLLIELVASRPQLLESEDSVIEFVDMVVPLIESVQSFVWRRQMVAYFSRFASHAGPEVQLPGAETVAVGFADMAGFTTLTRRATEADLRQVLEAFEAIATEIVGGCGGRIVKTIGDEVLFVADSPDAAAEIALQLQEAAEANELLPALRIGIAAGPVVSRLGDVYGSTVNIASRLTSICRPGWVLVDREMAEQLREDERFVLKPRRPESVRGYHHLRQWRLRRADESGGRQPGGRRTEPKAARSRR
jgi:adenylate cyclase